jgi:zinc transporter 1
MWKFYYSYHNIELFFLIEHGHGHGHGHGHSHGHSHGKKSDDENIVPIDEILVHPAASRRSIVMAAQEAQESRESREIIENDDSNLPPSSSNNVKEEESDKNDKQTTSEKTEDDSNNHDHKSHKKSKNLNMRGVFIHVLGDALGNIGVVCSGLFIYFTHFSWRFYIDPLVR